MTPTPTQIATQAAEQIANGVCHEIDKTLLLADGSTAYDATVKILTPLILAAAAKMVRESGALDALLSCGPMAEYPSEEWSRLSDAKFAALGKLRSISEGEQREAKQGDS